MRRWIVQPVGSAGGRMTKFINRRTFSAGDIIFHEGDAGSQAFVLQAGKVRILKNRNNGEKGTLGFVEPGGIFGEMALIDSMPRMATAVAEEPCTCIVISEDMLKKKLKASDPVVRMMIVVMIRMLRAMAEQAPLETTDLEAIRAGIQQAPAPSDEDKEAPAA